MPVVVTCPACQRKARIPRAAVGKTVKCPSCGSNFLATRGDDSVPAGRPVEAEDSSELPSEPASSADNAGGVERTGVGLMTLSEAFFAVSMALYLLIGLIAMVPADAGEKSPVLTSASQVMAVIAVLTGSIGTVTTLIGAVFCIVPPAALPARAAAASVMILSLLIVVRTPTGPNRDLVALLAPPVFQSARQAMLAIYVRIQARRLGDAATASMATVLADAFPLVVIGLATLAVLVSLFSGKPHPTFDQTIRTLDQLAQTVLVAWSAFVLWRVRGKLRLS